MSTTRVKIRVSGLFRLVCNVNVIMVVYVNQVIPVSIKTLVCVINKLTKNMSIYSLVYKTFTETPLEMDTRPGSVKTGLLLILNCLCFCWNFFSSLKRWDETSECLCLISCLELEEGREILHDTCISGTVLHYIPAPFVQCPLGIFGLIQRLDTFSRVTLQWRLRIQFFSRYHCIWGYSRSRYLVQLYVQIAGFLSKGVISRTKMFSLWWTFEKVKNIQLFVKHRVLENKRIKNKFLWLITFFHYIWQKAIMENNFKKCLNNINTILFEPWFINNFIASHYFFLLI